jgi:hypothetical protein
MHMRWEQTLRALHALVGRKLTVQVDATTLPLGPYAACVAGTLRGAVAVGSDGWQKPDDEHYCFHFMEEDQAGFPLVAADFEQPCGSTR